MWILGVYVEAVGGVGVEVKTDVEAAVWDEVGDRDGRGLLAAAVGDSASSLPESRGCLPAAGERSDEPAPFSVVLRADCGEENRSQQS